jgi:FAD/FMN-containing dehydrogenase
MEPGVINDTLRQAARAHGLTFAPDPTTHQFCTLGGNIGNNSCGAHTVMGGKSVDNVEVTKEACFRQFGVGFVALNPPYRRTG